MSILLDRRIDGTVALYIDGDLQFDSRDESIYHECLVLPAVSLAHTRLGSDLRVLVIGGGDGLGVRELLKSTAVKCIDLVDYSQEMLDLFKNELPDLNGHSLSDSKVTLYCHDAWDFVEESISKGSTFDLIISDLTVAQDQEGARFHSIDWYERLAKILTAGGMLSINCVSPWATPRAYWSIFNAVRTANLQALPYRASVPSFIRHGYGADWGFMLASNQVISKDELTNQLKLPFPRKSLKDTAHLLSLFLFPQEIADLCAHSQPARMPSDIFIHYLFNDEEIENVSGAPWNALAFDLNNLCLPPADPGDYMLPPGVRQALHARCHSAEEETALFTNVLELMPSLQRSHTRKLVADFLADPSAFLEGIDLEGLVGELRERITELPGQLAAELDVLHEKLRNWSGDHLDLLTAGSRIMTVVTLVVILGNLIYPDAAYGKGGHAGGGDRGTHAGGEHAGARAGDHGDRGDRGGRGDRDDRGFDRGDRGFDHHYDHFGHWGGYNHWGNRWGGYGYRHWGGWARPWHTWYGGGWGGWGVPFYAAGPGYVNVNYNGGDTIDEQGSVSPARPYSYQNTVNNYSWNDTTASNSGNTQDNRSDDDSDDSDDSTVAVTKTDSDYRLGPDTDILPDGKVAVYLTDKAYMLVSPQGTLIIDQDTGKPIMSLQSDPSLVWHIVSEIKRQSAGLQSASQSRQSSMDWSGKTGFSKDGQQKDAQQNDEQDEGQKEVQNINTAVSLLNKAGEAFQGVSASPPPPAKPPLEGALEVFAGTWMTSDGKYLLLQKLDGSLVYMTNNELLKDEGKVKINQPYPDKFKQVVTAYLQQLVQESDAEKSSLQQNEQDAQTRLSHLQQMSQNGQPGEKTEVGRSMDSSSVRVNTNTDDGEAKPDPEEASRRLQQAIKRTQKRLDNIQNELQQIPQETEIAKKILTAFQGQ